MGADADQLLLHTAAQSQRRIDAGEHQLCVRPERRRGADLRASLCLAGRHVDRPTADPVPAGAFASVALRAETFMTVPSPTITTPFSPLRFALRELRGGLHGFRIFVACIALGVMAIAGVGSFSRSLTDGINREGQVILGGDLSFSLIHREVDAAERRFLESRGQVSSGATMRAMASAEGGSRALVELKAVDALYPLYGQVVPDPEMPLDRALAQRDGAFGAAVDSTLLARLNLKPGARLTIGSATIEVATVIQSEPDKLASGIGFGPRIVLSEAGLRATALLGPGSLARWNYRLKRPGSSGRAPEA